MGTSSKSTFAVLVRGVFPVSLHRLEGFVVVFCVGVDPVSNCVYVPVVACPLGDSMCTLVINGQSLYK